jgi:hypothetical protein
VGLSLGHVDYHHTVGGVVSDVPPCIDATNDHANDNKTSYNGKPSEDLLPLYLSVFPRDDEEAHSLAHQHDCKAHDVVAPWYSLRRSHTLQIGLWELLLSLRHVTLDVGLDHKDVECATIERRAGDDISLVWMLENRAKHTVSVGFYDLLPKQPPGLIDLDQ